ncbi:DUF4856 domain-containing protein [Nisaea acidiphila]|uniref:DUF4856 domain-containing protein n=1 Tax=Nisaea acidiphila TaxID=1862145 RepID=A0A9J7AWB5_9PROT|nr:DUF4856 domain-containing protein [Nisaea acidiphila]UUX51090.1 DUF4856 domain-containing protein [Nisaea acidiphila]
MRKLPMLATTILAAFSISAPAVADDRVYADFPVTVKGYTGSKTSSVSYSGQIARQALHDSLKKLAGSGDGSSPEDLKARMLAYFSASDAGRGILAPTSKGDFVIAQSTIDEISKKKNLAGKTTKATITGMPNNMTGPELVEFWIGKASEAKGGVDLANGYDYAQLISKFIMGATFYNQAVDGYLDEYLGADKKPNDKPYSDGAAYTGKEHAWDEAFGYFGTPAHTMRLTAKQVYDINKRKGAEALAAADFNKDGKVDLKTEMTFGPAYYAAGFDASVYDKGNATSYLHTITGAFLDGRQLLTDANGEKLTDAQRASLRKHAAVISENWERVLAEAVFKYAGSVYKDMVKLQTIMEANGDTTKVYGNYVKHWGELKGFSLALQTGKDNLGETATRLNRLIGYGPLLTNSSQVVDIDSKGNYVRDQGAAWGEYMLHMGKVQKLMIDEFDVTARNNDVTGDLADLAKALGGSASAEND